MFSTSRWEDKLCYGMSGVGLSWKGREHYVFLSIVPLILCFKIPDFSTNLQFSSFWELLMSNVWQGWQHTQFTFSIWFLFWAAGSSCLKVNHEGLFYCALADGKMATKSISSSLEVKRQTTKTVKKYGTCISELICSFIFLCFYERAICWKPHR